MNSRAQATTLSNTSQLIGLVVSVVLCFAASGIGAWFAYPAIREGWYAALNKPAWTPPAWVFGPAWTLLYLMMAVAAWLVWRRRGFAGARLPLALFLVQLALNALWSYCFFGLRRPGLALVEIMFLWLAVFATMLSCWRVAHPAGWLMWPYLLWVTFAAFLNLSISRLNH